MSVPGRDAERGATRTDGRDAGSDGSTPNEGLDANGPATGVTCAGALCNDPLPDTPARRAAACCGSEPECVLCPLDARNAHLSLQQLWDQGLYANLPRLGFR